MGFWGYASMATYGNNNQNGFTFFLVIPLLWVHFVLANIVHCTTIGVVGSWYFSPGLESVVKPSLKRACTKSLGMQYLLNGCARCLLSLDAWCA
jgi:hypothetical protein